MKKVTFVILAFVPASILANLPNTFGGITGGHIFAHNGAPAKPVILEVKKGQKIDFEKIKEQNLGDGQSVMILGRLDSDVIHQIAFKKKQSLVRTLLEEHGMIVEGKLVDPSYGPMLEKAEFLESINAGQLLASASEIETMIEKGETKSNKKDLQTVVNRANMNYELSAKAKSFAQTHIKQNNLTFETIKTDKSFVAGDVTVAVLNLDVVSSEKINFPVRMLLPYVVTSNGKRPDYLFVVTRKTVELIPNSWAFSGSTFVENTLESKGLTQWTDESKVNEGRSIWTLVPSEAYTTETFVGYMTESVNVMQEKCGVPVNA